MQTPEKPRKREMKPENPRADTGKTPESGILTIWEMNTRKRKNVKTAAENRGSRRPERRKRNRYAEK